MNIGICGYGVIGSGVKTLVEKQNNMSVLKVFDRPIKKEELGFLYTDNYADITKSKDIDVVVEAMGGDKLPHEIIKDALLNKKSVVTSNKEVVSLHLDEFEELAKENGVCFMFEASVGGGIPIIASLIQNRKLNEINHIYGILNGTTNFILTKIEEGMSFDEALKEAQRLGFAEADPTADLEGLDMVRKISILSNIAYQTFVDVNKVSHRGIKGITKEIIDSIKKEGNTLKFICESKKNGDEISLCVEPVIFKNDAVISNIKNEFNYVMIDGETNGKLGFVGKGAGSYPTASAMVSDLYLIKNKNYNYLDLQNKYSYFEDKEKEYVVYSKNGKILKTVNGIENENEKEFYARIFKG